MAGSNKFKGLNERNLSVLLLMASRNDGFDLVELLYNLEIRSIDTLEKRVLREFSELTDLGERQKYANNIIIADNLPICREFYRIISNGYNRDSYLKSFASKAKRKERAPRVWKFYEEFYEVSDVLRSKKQKVEDTINALRENTEGSGWRLNYRRRINFKA